MFFRDVNQLSPSSVSATVPEDLMFSSSSEPPQKREMYFNYGYRKLYEENVENKELEKPTKLTKRKSFCYIC
jgi:hypothetical protein